MAGMLPGVECARRRRLRQGGSSSGAAEAPCGTRRPSFCLYAGGHDHAHLGSAAASKERISSVCKEMMARAWTLDTNAREAKERLDQKLEGKENLWSRGVCVWQLMLLLCLSVLHRCSLPYGSSQPQHFHF